MTSTAGSVYRFGAFRLNPAARQLLRGDEPIELPRRAFDCLFFLIVHRDRALSRNELITKLWGHPDVADAQLIKLISLLRHEIGDDSQESQFIRTVSGFGYHWIAPTSEQPIQNTGEIRQADGAAAQRHLPKWVAVPIVLAAALVTAISIHYANRLREPPEPLQRVSGEAVAVLPLAIETADSDDTDWIRLGVMDLIAARLREAGLPVPPSDSVVAAFHVTRTLPEAERMAGLRRTLGADILIRGVAKTSAGGWTVELIATTAGGASRRVRSAPADIIPTAGAAADMLLHALGEIVPAPAGRDDTLSELLQRATAAALALDLDGAREILARAPATPAAEPALVSQLAWIEFLAGNHEQAERILDQALGNPRVASQPRLHAEILTRRGIVAINRQEDWAAGMTYLDTAIAVLEDDAWAPELSTALALRGGVLTHLHEFDAAASDLSHARIQFEGSADRYNLDRIHNYFGYLELERQRPEAAMPHFLASIEISESFGNTHGLRASLHGLLTAQMRLLRWPDALVTSDRLQALHERVDNPVWRHGIEIERAATLIGLGRHGDAEVILDNMQANEPDLPGSTVCYAEAVRAKLAWAKSRPDAAMQAAARSLQRWPAQTCGPENHPPTRTALLYQRASAANGHPVAAARFMLDMSNSDDGEHPAGEHDWRLLIRQSALEDDPASLVARAEWAALHDQHELAEHLFEEAIALAGAWSVPDTVLLAADAYARWLLSRKRMPDALAPAGRVSNWIEHDYDSALLQTTVLHAGGHRDAWAAALRHAQRLAGEREIPATLLRPPE